MIKDSRISICLSIVGKLSVTIIIPIDIARKHGLDRPSNVVVEEAEEAIMIRKLEVQSDHEFAVE